MQAAREAFGPAAILSPSVSFADAFAAVQQGSGDAAIVPVENSTNGSVVQTLDLLADRNRLYEDIQVCAEHYLTVHHCVLVRKDGFPEERPSIASIAKLYTHPQVWGQCDRFLSQNLKGVERQDVSSTSKAAEIISGQADTGRSAAIANRFAAEYHGLDVLDADIEDQPDNTTRFLILRNATSKRTAQLSLSFGGSTDTATCSKTTMKTLISFTINQASPGALADALLVFKIHGLNLTSINTRPSRRSPWHYVFFVECRWDLDTDGGDLVKGLSTSLGAIVEDYRELGAWIDQLPQHG